ncbi:putative E3 ubiquitin-protein ligase SINA-like 6 [Rhododendron vialii]|uniref:putative E3 ubiquitin-protein ligase SINA-like 6 n=1 Tax=Rhododendron vialii TaxID=182163 RepID=UPI00265D9618|nr:putative E3 ubiquitin-protein ligase SINA-like 6 [Rhododendron vialii]
MANTPPSRDHLNWAKVRDWQKDLDYLCSNHQSSKKRRTAVKEEEEEEAAAWTNVFGCSAKASGDPSNFLTLTDADLLDCPICFQNLSIPVFQCLNGHLACLSCCNKVRNKCPTCSSTIGHNRCRPIEKIIESVKISCQYKKYGCTELVFRGKKSHHEGMCIYGPCSCPLSDCAFIGSFKKLSLHFSTDHSGSAKRFCYDCTFPISLELLQKYVILQEEQEGTVFILNNGVQNLGNVIDVCCMAPTSSERGFSYNLLATSGGRSVKLQSFAENVCGRIEHTPPNSFLMVPSDFFGSCGQLKLELRILRSPGEHLLRIFEKNIFHFHYI